MNLISYVKKTIKQNHMKKVHFNITLLLEELSSVPYVNGIFFAKIKFLESLKMTVCSPHKPVSNHKVQWKSNHSIMCKLAIEPETNSLESAYLKITIKQESTDGKTSTNYGFVIINISSFADKGNVECRRRYILASKNESIIRQTNSLLQISLQMCQTFGDPCFRVPEEDFSSCIDVTHIKSRDQISNNSVPTTPPLDLVLAQDENNDENDEYPNNDCLGSCFDNLKVPQTSYRGHRRNISDNTSIWMQPRNSDPHFCDDMGLVDADLRRYHSTLNCSEHPGSTRNVNYQESSAFTNKQILISSTRGSRAKIVEDVFRTCFDPPIQKLN